MGSFVPITDGAQVELVMLLGGQVVENRLWFVNRQPPNTSTQIDALAQGVFDWHTAGVLPSLSQDLQLLFVQASDWTATPPPLASVAGTSTNGGVAEKSYSANVAARIWFYSSLTTGRIRNSNFVPGLPDSAVTLNTLDATFQGIIRDAYIDLIDAATLFGPFPAWRWVCASAWDGGSLRTEQEARRVDFIRWLRNTTAQRRKRLPT